MAVGYGILYLQPCYYTIVMHCLTSKPLNLLANWVCGPAVVQESKIGSDWSQNANHLFGEEPDLIYM